MRRWEWVALLVIAGTFVGYSPALGSPPAINPARFLILFFVTIAATWVDALRRSVSPVGSAAGAAMFFQGWVLNPGWRDVFMGTIVVAGIFLATKRIERILAKAERQERELREARDQALRLKVAPHFLFNTLNTVKAQLASDPQGAAGTVDRLAALLRQALDGTGRHTIPLREELAFVESYLGIERVRLGPRLRVALEIPERAEAVEVPPFSLQVLAENAVKHGIAPREQGGEIRITARTEPWGTREKISLCVESPASTALTTGTGVGLETLRARLRAPEDLRLEERDGVFRATFGWIDDREPARA